MQSAMIRRSLAVFAFLFFAVPGLVAASQDPEALIRDLGSRAVQSLTGPNLSDAERERQFRVLFREAFAIESMARTAVGWYWRTMSEAQRQEYLGLFEDHIVDAYAQRFSEYTGETFQVTGSRATADGAVVSSTIVQPRGENIRVDWYMEPENGELRILDVQMVGVSMLATKQSEFASAIQQGGGNIDTFLDRLRRITERVRQNARRG